jgi:hypothetical protein
MLILIGEKPPVSAGSFNVSAFLYISLFFAGFQPTTATLTPEILA